MKKTEQKPLRYIKQSEKTSRASHLSNPFNSISNESSIEEFSDEENDDNDEVLSDKLGIEKGQNRKNSPQIMIEEFSSSDDLESINARRQESSSSSELTQQSGSYLGDDRIDDSDLFNTITKTIVETGTVNEN